MHFVNRSATALAVLALSAGAGFAQQPPSSAFGGLSVGLPGPISPSSWPTQYLPGSTLPGGAAAYVVSPNGQWGAFVSAIRTSDYAGVTNAIADTALGVADSAAHASLLWGRYTETVIPQGAIPYLTIGHENSQDNRAGDCASIDPFTYAQGSQSGACVVERLDAGVGGAYLTGSISGTTLSVSAVINGFVRPGYTVTGAGVTAGTQIIGYGSGSGGTGTYTLNLSQTVAPEALALSAHEVSALLDLTNNQGLAKVGINFDYRAVDRNSGYGRAIQFGPQMGMSWYNGLGAEGWRIASTSNAGNGMILLGNNQWDLYLGESNAFHLIGAKVTGVQVGPALSSAGMSPTCIVTGAGTGATCALAKGSNGIAGKMQITAAASAAAYGSITLTLAAAAAPHNANCEAQLSNGTAAWNGLAALVISTDGTTVTAWAWNNNSASLTNGNTYNVSYHCIGY